MLRPPLDLIRRALEEDGAEADITTLSTVPEQQQSSGSILTRASGVIAGLAIAAATFRLLDDSVSVELQVHDGAVVQPGDVLAHLSGPDVLAQCRTGCA